jgi:hypothetical protein
MKLITTTFRYAVKDSEDSKNKAIKVVEELHLFDSNEFSYSSFVVTEDEYFTYWELFDKITHVREVK